MSENRVKELREKKGMTQTALADACGLYESVISKIELQKTTPFLKNALKISAALEERVEDVFIKDEK